MKKLRCESCNGDLVVDEKKEYATCNYCGTKYKLNDDMTINIKIDDSIASSVKKVSKFMIIPFIMIAIIIIAVIVVIIVSTSKSQSSFDKNKFNSQFAFQSGTQYKIFVDSLIDTVNESNKKNSDHQVVLVYKDKGVTSNDDLISIKHSLNNNKYEVIYNYDEDGYLNKIVIEDIA